MRQSTLGSSTVAVHRAAAIANSPNLAIEQDARPYSLDIGTLGPYALALVMNPLVKGIQQVGRLHYGGIKPAIRESLSSEHSDIFVLVD